MKFEVVNGFGVCFVDEQLTIKQVLNKIHYWKKYGYSLLRITGKKEQVLIHHTFNGLNIIRTQKRELN